MFLSNIDPQNSLSLIVAGEYANTLVHVYNHNTQWETTVELTNDSVVTIPISYANGYSNPQGTTTTGGLNITATHPISLYASNFRMSSYDITTILPTAVLGTRYMAQTYAEVGFPEEEIGFVATEDSTEITVNFRQPNETIHVTLQRGQSHQIRRSSLSGTTAISNGKPFAMFQGHRCTPVGMCDACDHLYEQVLPELLWGKQFMLIPTVGRTNGDMVKVTTWEDTCALTLDGEPLATLAARESYEFTLPNANAQMLRASKPVLTCLYLKGFDCSVDSIGDPSAVIIPPVEQGLQRVTFAATNTTTTTQHYTNIAVHNADVPYMELDGHPIDSAFTATSSGYSYAQLAVSPGLHTLSNANGPFVSHFYGLGIAESYAYIAGMATIDLSYRLYNDDHNTSGMALQHTYCQGDTGHFSIAHPERQVRADWLVDSQFVAHDTCAISYVFNTPGAHVVSAIYDLCDTLFARAFVDSSQDILDVDTICFDSTYQWQGHYYDSTGLYSQTYQNVFGCDSTRRLDLFVVPRPQMTIDRQIDCHSGIYRLDVDLAEASGCPLQWHSSPPDTLLWGHEGDGVVTVMPHADPTIYSLDVDYSCPFTETFALAPVEWPHADWTIRPAFLTNEQPYFDAYDLSQSVDSRQWIVDGQLQATTQAHLQYTALHSADSVYLMLIVEKSTCADTLQQTLPFSHAAVWAPNAFSPEADNNNRFVIVLNEGVAEDFRVYNRSGVLVAHSDGPAPEWDGTHHGTPCPQGAYVWHLRYRRNDNPDQLHTLTGTVTLLR